MTTPPQPKGLLASLRGRVARLLGRAEEPPPFEGSSSYWEDRYRNEGSSGSGSEGRLAEFKAEFLNDLVADHGIGSVLELGCGDGQQLARSRYPSYVGVDVSPTTVQACRELFADDPTKSFVLLGDLPADATADLAMSIDVIYHLVEDEVFHAHVDRAFAIGQRLVVLYTSDGDVPSAPPAPHVRHRPILDVVAERAPGWQLLEHRPNPYPYDPEDPTGTSFADFFVFAPRTSPDR